MLKNAQEVKKKNKQDEEEKVEIEYYLSISTAKVTRTTRRYTLNNRLCVWNYV